MEFFITIFVLIAMILLNSFFVMTEISIITSKKAKIKKMIADGALGASKALDLMEKPEFFLSAVQIGITLISILIGIYSGSVISEYISPYVAMIPYLKPYSTFISDSVILIILTYFTVLGEVLPKRIAMIYPEKFSCKLSYFMHFFMTLFHPIIFCVGASTKFLMKLMGVAKTKTILYHEELRYLVSQAESEKGFDQSEIKMLDSLTYLTDMQVASLMTPRNKIISIDTSVATHHNIKKIKKYHYNYFPITNGDIANIVGLISTKYFVAQDISKSNFESLVKKHSVKCIYIPEMATVLQLLKLFQVERRTVAMVVDEYGEIEGIITLNDILKILVGGIAVKGGQKEVVDIHQKKDGSYIVNGSALIENVTKIMNIQELPGDAQEDYINIAGFVLRQLGKVPKKGDSFSVKEWKFTVLSMDKNRIESLSLSKK